MPDEGTAAETAAAAEVKYSVSPGLSARLARQNISLAITPYLSGLLNCIGRNVEGGINVYQPAMPKPMGLCLGGDTGLTMTAGYQIMQFENCAEA